MSLPTAGLPRSVLLNMVLILAAALAARTWIRDIPPSAPTEPTKPKARRVKSRVGGRQSPNLNADEPNRHSPPSAAPLPPLSGEHTKRWREHVRSPVVEAAWETLCGGIVQEFIYDSWYAFLTPDRSFPAEIRRILNHAFGQLSARARRADLRAVLEDCSELFMEQVELYRDTREGVLLDRNSAAAVDFTSGDSARRERALRQRMELDGNLHPALQQPEGDYKMLKAVSDGLVGVLLDPKDSGQVVTRSVARELLAACVLRPLLLWCAPYYVNKGMYRLLQGQVERRQPPENTAVPAEAEAAKQRQLRGNWEFEQRIVKTVEAEATLQRKESSARQAMPPPPPRTLRHVRSRSYDDVVASMNKADHAQPVRFWSETSAPEHPSHVAPPHGTLNGGSYTSAGSSAAGGNAPRAVPATRIPDFGSEMNGGASPTSSHSATSPVRHMQQQQHPTSGVLIHPVNNGNDHSEVATHSGTSYSIDASPFDQDASFSSPLRLDMPIEKEGYNNAQAQHHSMPAHLLARQVINCPDGFVGSPRAKVVAADLNTSGTKDFVVYKIRVGDDSGREWTVSRRYRNFEVLHRQLRSLPGYNSKLPAKRIFVHTKNAEDVEDRRQALDGYIQELLRAPQLASSRDLWEFLRSGSERFESLGELCTDAKRGTLKRGLSRSMIAGAQSIGRGVVGATVDVTQAVTHGVKTGVTEVTSAAVGGVGAVLQEARSSLGMGPNARHRRSASVPEEMEDFDPMSGSGQTPLVPKQQHQHKQDSLSRAGAGLLRTATASARKVRNVLVPHGGPAHSGGTSGDFTGRMLFPKDQALQVERQQQQQQPYAGSATSSSDINLLYGSSPDKRAGRVASQRRPKSRNASPTKQRRGGNANANGNGGGGGSEGYIGGVAERSAAFYPSSNPSFAFPEGYAYAALDASGLSDPGAVAEATIEVDAFGAPSPGGYIFGQSPSEGPPSPESLGSERSMGPGLDYEACAGISAPLYEIVDCLFQLQTRGFFRRQVYSMARQVLSLAIGDAIDVYLISRLRLLSQDNTIARIIQLIQSSLWPGGLWFQNSPQFLAAHPEVAAARKATAAGCPTAAAHARPGNALSPEGYLEQTGARPIDEDEVREAVGELLFQRAPGALVGLVGRRSYTEGAEDLYEMMQSPAMMRQLGYGLLEIFSLHLCPELKSLFQKLEHGGL